MPVPVVHIKFERVQTWLFSIPRLRAMVGANVLLLEVLREKLPALVREQGRGWEQEPGKRKHFPVTDANDPWRAFDQPRESAELGITSQDGGHFEVNLKRGAKAFADAADELLRRELPGLRFSIKIDGQSVPGRSTYLSGELPVLAPCSWSGQGLASGITRQGTDREGASLEACRRQDAARHAESDTSSTPLSVLMAQVKGGDVAPGFKELAAGRYLAVIHADGNGVGSELREESNAKDRAAFHYANRVLLRRALEYALPRCQDDGDDGTPIKPILPLMLGGDDLLIVCRATVALQFVVDLCEKLADLQRVEKRSDKRDFRLTLGVGVVVAPFSLPFHELHQVADALATSAKRRVRELESTKTYSVVDWAVFTSSWAEKDLSEVRRRDWLRGAGEQRRLLSLRPLPVLREHAPPYSLQELLEEADALKKAPRSQLIHLVEELGRGKHLGELAWHELSSRAGEALKAAKINRPWEPISPPTTSSFSKGTKPSPSKPEAAASGHFTRIHDLVEVLEIPRLGSAPRPVSVTTTRSSEVADVAS